MNKHYIGSRKKESSYTK